MANAWRGKSSLLQRRLLVTRSGTTKAGNAEWTQEELVDFRVRMAPNLPKECMQPLERLMPPFFAWWRNGFRNPILPHWVTAWCKTPQYQSVGPLVPQTILLNRTPFGFNG